MTYTSNYLSFKEIRMSVNETVNIPAISHCFGGRDDSDVDIISLSIIGQFHNRQLMVYPSSLHHNSRLFIHLLQNIPRNLLDYEKIFR